MNKHLFILIFFIALILNNLAANTVTWNLKSLYGITQAGFASIIADAKKHFSTLPNDSIIIQIDSGTYVIGGNGSNGITINALGTAGTSGRLIFKGAGMDQTILVFTDITQDMVHGADVYGLEFRDMNMTRDRYTVTQGTVVSVAAGEIILELHDGFPTPLDLWQDISQGRFLRRYTTSTTDPQVIPVDNDQVPYGWRSGAAKKPDLVQGRQWRFYLNSTTLLLSNYHVGEYVGVKSKFEGQTYWFQRGSNLVFENIRWTHSSRGLVRGGLSNVLIKGCRIDRGAPILGQTPCMSTPSGGPQMNQYVSSGDPLSTNMVLEDCFFESTGDDCVAFFNVNGGRVINTTLRNSFCRGILVTQDAYNICVLGTTIPNSKIELEDKPSASPNLRTPVSTYSLDTAYAAGFIDKSCSADYAPLVDSLALVDLYNSTGGSNWTNNSNWLTTAPLSSWYGITVSGGNVTGINLNNGNGLRGTIPTSIGNLTHLTNIDLSNNQLNGTVPVTMGNLTNLTDLNVSYNQLSGFIPSSLGNLNNLKTLSLNNNQFTYAGMEGIVSVASVTNHYSPQAIIKLVNNNNILSVSVGGTASNNTFKWYLNGSLVATIAADSTYMPAIIGKYAVVVNNAVAANLTLYSDTVTITGLTGINISGNILAPDSLGNFTKTVPNVFITNKGDTPVLYSNGQYSFSADSGSNVVLTLTKNNDINKANGVTAIDIALTQSHILSKNIFNSPYKIIAADVTGDGKVTALDIVYMKRLILGIDTCFTYGAAKDKRLWTFVDSSYKFPDTTNPFPYKDSIVVTGLSTSKTNQTFIGCKMGDVNWDWNPAIARPMVNNIDAVELSSSLANTYPSDALAGRTDGYVHIPIRVKNFREMLGMQYTISFNASVLKWVGVDNNLLNFEMGTNHAEEGKISFLWVDTKNEIKTLEDGSVLFDLVFEKTGDCISEQLDLDGSVTSIVAYDKDYQSHNVVFKPSAINSLDTKENWVVAPNPATNGVIHVQMNLKDNKTVVFRLLDKTGKLLMLKQVEGVKGGNNITLREERVVAPGTYYLQAVGVEGVKQILIK